jgi:hypothetical protein
LTALSFVSSVWAQAGNAIEFKVTSSFVAGDAKFPAGTYTIRQDPDNQQEWEISNDSKGYSAFLPTEPSSSTTSNQKRLKRNLDPRTCERFFCANLLRRKEGCQGRLSDQGFPRRSKEVIALRKQWTRPGQKQIEV